jgi:hypothetical protein
LVCTVTVSVVVVVVVGVTLACWPLGPEGPLGAFGIASMIAVTAAAAPEFHRIPVAVTSTAWPGSVICRQCFLGKLRMHTTAPPSPSTTNVLAGSETISSTVPRTPSDAVGVEMT